MPKGINKIKKSRIKDSLLKGNSIRQALIDAKYAKTTAHSKCNSTTNRCVKVCMDEIAQEFKASDLTVDDVLKSVNSVRTDPKANHSDKLRANELLGKFLKMWVDRSETTQTNPDKIIITYNKEPSTRLPLLNNSASNSLLEPSKPISSEDLT